MSRAKNRKYTPFLWTPAAAPDIDAVTRLRRHFRRPQTPMGEAWFMSKTRRMFDLSGDLAALPAEDLLQPLEAITSGAVCFGPMREWTEWFHYILAERSANAWCAEPFGPSLMEPLIAAFITQYPEGVPTDPIPAFARTHWRLWGARSCPPLDGRMGELTSAISCIATGRATPSTGAGLTPAAICHPRCSFA